MNSLDLTASVTAIANAIAVKLSTLEIAVVAGVLVQLGDTLATIAALNALKDEESAEQ